MMNNRYLRLFVAQTKLLTAEKMKLDRFCQHGEYLAYKIALPPEANVDLATTVDVKFIFSVDLEDRQYHFTNDNISEELFAAFELHLSSFLNELFRRKTVYEQHNEAFAKLADKLIAELSEEERKTLAENIDINANNVLRILGVSPDVLS